MKRKVIFFTICMLFILTLLAGSISVTAQTPQPPKQPYLPLNIPPHLTSSHPLPGTAGVESSNSSITLGQPGLSFRYVSTFGVTQEPYQSDAIHLYRPHGIFIDSVNNLYTVEEYGQRLLGYNAAGVNILSIGHAGINTLSNGYLNFPADVTKGSSSNLWVVMDHAVKAFDSTGNQLLVFPSDDPWQSGNDNAHFDHPLGIAFDHNGFLFISDYYNHRIQVYSVSGSVLTYVNTIGVTGTLGADNEHFNLPGGIAFDSSNALYVMDVANARVQKCTSANNWATWACTKFFGGAVGSDPASGQLSGASLGITIDSANNVFIADGTNYRVLKCTPGGVCTHFVGTVGVSGNDNTHFDDVTDVAVDSTGKVYVNDLNNMRIQVFTSAGNYVKTIGVTGVPYTADSVRYNEPYGISVTSNQGLYILEKNGSRLIKVNPDGSQVWTAGKAGVPGNDNNSFGYDAVLDTSGNPAESLDGKVYVPDTGNDRIQILNANTGGYLSTFGQYGQGDNQFNLPSGIAINPTNQDILVVDQANHRVQIYTSAWVYKATIGVTGVSGKDNSHLAYPRSVAVDSSGAVFVADSDNFRVQKCIPANGNTYTCSTLISGTGGVGNGFIDIHPVSVALDKAGRVYVISDWYYNLQVYDANGAFLTSLGYSWGSGNSELANPQGVAVDQSGNVFITDVFNHRVQKYAPGVPSWKQVNINGFGEQTNGAITSLEVFNEAIYAGTGNWDKGGRIYRATKGTDWTPVTDFGITSAYTATNPIVSDLREFQGKLYAGISWGGIPGQIWRSTDGTIWNQVVNDGFGDKSNQGITAFGIFNNSLYAGTYKSNGGVQIWRSSSGDASSWTLASLAKPNNSDLTNVTGFAVFNNQLFAAIESSENLGGMGQVWYTSDGTAWSLAAQPGFGEADNISTGGFAVFNGKLYLGLQNSKSGAQLWRTGNGTAWEKVTANCFGGSNYKVEGLSVYGNRLYAYMDNDETGLQVWVSADGLNWSQSRIDGFGDSNNNRALGSNAVTEFNGSLFFGTWNAANGGEIWQYGYSLYLSLAKKPLKLGLVTDTAGVNDKSFNQSAWAGVQKAALDFNIAAKYIESKQSTDYEKNIDQFASEGDDAIVTAGFLMGDATAAKARQYPYIKFAIIDNAYLPTKGSAACPDTVKDCYVDGGLTNVTSLMFQEDQAGFLAGVLAAGMTKTGTVCSVSGMEIPPVVRYVTGFQNGARWMKPGVKTLNVYIPSFVDSAKGKSTAESLIKQGCDVVFGVGGLTGNGALLAAKEKGAMAIGVDVDQYITYPEVKAVLLSSAAKNVDIAVYNYLKSLAAGTEKAGIFTATLQNGGVGLAPFHDWDSKIPQAVKDKIAQATKGLIDGTIKTGYQP